MIGILFKALAAILMTATVSQSVYADASSRKAGVAPPMSLAIIACRVEPNASLEQRGVDWRIPLECMRVVETVSDAAALSNFRLAPLSPNLSDYGICAEVGMAFAPTWEASHKNWAVVKVGCPTKIVDGAGNIIGWHMPECQGTLPGTNYPLRCRFDPSEI